MSIAHRLRSLVSRRAEAPASTAPSPPEDGVKLNLGSGFDIRDGWVNIDLHARHNPDIVCDVTSLDVIDDHHADYILAQDVLEHIHRARCQSALREWNRVLKDGGVVAIRVPNALGIADLLRQERFAPVDEQRRLLQNLFGTQGYEGDYHFNGFTETTLRADLEECGFEVVHLGEKDEWLFEAHARKVDHRPPSPLLKIMDDGAFLDAAYEEVMNRPADPEGKAYWLAQLAADTPREAVVEAFRAAR